MINTIMKIPLHSTRHVYYRKRDFPSSQWKLTDRENTNLLLQNLIEDVREEMSKLNSGNNIITQLMQFQ